MSTFATWRRSSSCLLLQFQRSAFSASDAHQRLKLFLIFLSKIADNAVDSRWPNWYDVWSSKQHPRTTHSPSMMMNVQNIRFKKVVLRAVEWLETVMTDLQSQSLNRWGTVSRAKIISFLPAHYICNGQCVALQELVLLQVGPWTLSVDINFVYIRKKAKDFDLFTDRFPQTLWRSLAHAAINKIVTFSSWIT